LLEESLERHRRVFGESHPRSARVLQALAPVVAVDDLERGGELLRRALEIRRATLKPDDPAIAETLDSLGEYYRQRRDYDRARDAYQQALDVWPTPESRRHPNAVTVLNDYGTFLSRLNEQAKAEALQREGLDIAREVLGSETLSVANLLNNLAVTQTALGRHREAEQLLKESHQTHRALLGARHWRTANVARNVGLLLALQQRYGEALPWVDEAVDTFASADLAIDPTRAAGLSTIRAQRAQVLFRLGRRAKALNLVRAAVMDLERRQPPDRHVLASARVILGRLLTESGRPGEAETVLAQALSALGDLGAQHPQFAAAACELARARLLRAPTAEERQRLHDCLPVYRGWGLAYREVVLALERLQADLTRGPGPPRSVRAVR
jgi:tetratricopeptide (TPR) repeat protein